MDRIRGWKTTVPGDIWSVDIGGTPTVCVVKEVVDRGDRITVTLKSVIESPINPLWVEPDSGCYAFLCGRCSETKLFTSKQSRDDWEQTHRAVGCQ